MRSLNVRMNSRLQRRVSVAVASNAFKAVRQLQHGAVCPTRSDYLQAYR